MIGVCTNIQFICRFIMNDMPQRMALSHRSDPQQAVIPDLLLNLLQVYAVIRCTHVADDHNS